MPVQAGEGGSIIVRKGDKGNMKVLNDRVFDVVVAGAGASGVAAAAAAARNGASVLLIEKYGFTGGTATAGLVHHWDPIRIIEASGIAVELFERLDRRGAVKDSYRPGVDMPFAFWEGGCGFDPEAFKRICLDMLLESGVKCLFHTSVTDAVVEDGEIRELEIFNRSGKGRVRGRVFIDATGNGDVFTYAGCGVQEGNGKGDFMSPTLAFTIGGVDTEQIFKYFDENPDEFGLHPRMGKYIKHHRQSAIIQGFYSLLKKARDNGELSAGIPETGIGLLVQPRYGEFHVNATRTLCKTPLDGWTVSELEISERENVEVLFKAMRKYIPGCENAYIMQTACEVGIRETRRLQGAYVYSLEDMENGVEFEDKVMRSKWAHCDTHSPVTMEWTFKFIEGPFYLPYRSLLSHEVGNLLTAGRCISTTSEAMASLRIIPRGAQMGEAAGTAAAAALSQSVKLRDVDVPSLQKTLVQNGVVL